MAFCKEHKSQSVLFTRFTLPNLKERERERGGGRQKKTRDWKKMDISCNLKKIVLPVMLRAVHYLLQNCSFIVSVLLIKSISISNYTSSYALTYSKFLNTLIYTDVCSVVNSLSQHNNSHHSLSKMPNQCALLFCCLIQFTTLVLHNTYCL